MRQTTFTCDRCKKSSPHNNFVKPVRINVNWGMVWGESYDQQSHTGDLCVACLNELGLFAPDAPKKIPAPSCCSLEDMIRTIVQETIEARP